MSLMKINPFFYVFIFFNATVFLPIVITGLKVYFLWYYPFTTSGQVSFLDPFLLICIVYVILSILIGYVVYRMKKGRFILVSGPMRLRNVIKATLKDSVGKWLVFTYIISYFISFMIVSGLLLLPNVNISPYFLPLTKISYQGYGLTLYGNFVFNPWLLFLGVINDVVLTIALILGYYIMSLIYVSLHAYEWKVPSSFRITSFNSLAGFLSASVPSIGTIAGICCLTPTAMNSLLFLLSNVPLTKGIMWKYGTFIAGTWTGGILQAIFLASPTFLGFLLIGLGIYEIYKISNTLANRVKL
ncbi:hypothetical protein D1869_04570 [Sulfurisphaera ohwakuensis]|uniref:Uncharacterized protein n=2 Tax=Sulfurisphaera ohwakuensis TaxID=69656 RepID=A0A650CFJ3_SULOH|nr:hypothetical protein D1869_04570 [Sulfurisphaera ohwakuensis]